MRAFLAALLLAAPLALHAQTTCFGSGAFQTCTDASGNTYNIQRFGNTTMMQGSNPNGSQWNQTSQTLGNTTYQNGTAANGRPWNDTTTNLPGMQIHQGMDSHGRPYSLTCTQWGCN
jgi:hypothetical protein